MSEAQVIASYPRSGSTWLRCVLFKLTRPGEDMDMEAVNSVIPTLEDDSEMLSSIQFPDYFKTHQLRCGQRIIHLHRHVGDVLVSYWHYLRKFNYEQRTLEEFLEDLDYGQEWRDHANHYFPCEVDISYEQLKNPKVIKQVIPDASLAQINKALTACAIDKLRVMEKHGFGSRPTGDPEIKFFRKGTTGQWKDLPLEIGETLIEKNHKELRMLGYL
ncbi:MAG: putative sulfotransferase domain protein [Prokaryotic dsDNA virus sp.]|nr:MAG: putative sulfotransferase domain protein [Prokaryotic dsDNA virus sp.]|tara:strand:- start:54874 stop:55521 length:648 start_codon:yes stop_codon:yes gene_type:complete